VQFAFAHESLVVYRLALGSAAEVCAVLDLAGLPGGEAQQVALRRVGAMLARMAC